jgi:hypothetical protein
MSASHTVFEHHDETKAIRAPWVFAGKVLFALALVVAATIALVRTEILVADPRQLGNTDLLLIAP